MSLDFKLVDQGDGGTEVAGTVIATDMGTLIVRLDGYGDACSGEGHGFPIMVEVLNGEVRVVLWSEINQHDPTHVVPMEGARESNWKGD